MRRCNSLPQVIYPISFDGKLRPIGFAYLPKVSLERTVRSVRYKGRYSLNKNEKDDNGDRYSSERSRAHSGSGIRTYPYCLDENSQPYKSIPSKPISTDVVISNIEPPISASSVEDCAIHTGSMDRICFFKTLQQISLNANLPPQSLLKNTKYLMTLKNEKHKKGDLLWLSFQAVLAGRNMKTWRDQFDSLRAQDSYIVERRIREGSVLDDILEFRFTDVKTDMHTKLQKVADILDRLNSFECLFPSFTYMMKVMNFTKKLNDRIGLLTMWYKTTRSLCDTIDEVGKILGISDSCYAFDSSVFGTLSRSDSLTSLATSCSSSEATKLEDAGPLKPKLSVPSNLDFAYSSLDPSSEAPTLKNQSFSRYTGFVSKSLKLKGMRRVLQRIENVCAVAISKAAILLQKPPGSYAEAARTANSDSRRYLPLAANCFTSKILEGLSKFKACEKQNEKYSVYHEEFVAMGLPSFVGLFCYLARIPLDLVDEWLKMRGNMQLNTDLLTLQAAMEDSRDCLRAAITVKHTYVVLMQMINLDNKKLLGNLSDFENHLSDLFKNYLICIRHWALAGLSASACAGWGDRFLSDLREEWKLSRRFAVNVMCGDDVAVHIFCCIGKDLLIRMVKQYLSEASDLLEERRSDFDVNSGRKIRSQIHVACRHFRELVKELHSRALRALSFASSMVYDLEKCALYRIKVNGQELLYQLYAKSYALVVLPFKLSNYIVFCDENAASGSIDFVHVLLTSAYARYEDELPPNIAKGSGYLLIFTQKSFGCFSPENWRGKRVLIDANADGVLSLHPLRFDADLCLVALNDFQLTKARQQLESILKTVKNCLLDVAEEHFCCYEVLCDDVSQLKEEVSDAYVEIWSGLVERMVDKILDGRSLKTLDMKELNTMRDTLLQAYWLSFEYRREMFRMLPMSMRKDFAVGNVEWIRHWSSFLTQFRADGVKHWATRRSKFINFAADPRLTLLLSDEKYKELASLINSCISRTTAHSILVVRDAQNDLGEDGDAVLDQQEDTASVISTSLSSAAPDRVSKIRIAVENLDKRRDEFLKKQEKIGCVKDIVRKDLSLNAVCGVKRRAPFEWRRTDNKIGKGKFGTVYIVLTQKNPGVMAMKQIAIDGSNKGVRGLIDEIENLRKLDHENIVKYYATEVHLEEVLIFMEYCPGGTLENKCTEAIPMPCARWYTCCLLKAVEYIHERMIIHRDIKPANIFIGRENVLKLGDFGSSVRLRGGTTAFGEIIQWAGTPAYMAPEVQTLGGKVERNSGEELAGYGRAADIWSVGCVVLEMCTGKPPWHGLDMFQIVFLVGSGMRPSIPPKLAADNNCVSFLDLCFQCVPENRATASTLRQHLFANVTEDAKSTN